MSQCSHEEAVQVFLKADDPITVEVKRRSSSSTAEDSISPQRTPPPLRPEKEINSIGCQTDDLIPLAANVFDESPVSDQIVNIFDECLVPDVDFEVSFLVN